VKGQLYVPSDLLPRKILRYPSGRRLSGRRADLEVMKRREGRDVLLLEGIKARFLEKREEKRRVGRDLLLLKGIEARFLEKREEKREKKREEKRRDETR
jgi:hypothetical protein